MERGGGWHPGWRGAQEQGLRSMGVRLSFVHLLHKRLRSASFWNVPGAGDTAGNRQRYPPGGLWAGERRALGHARRVNLYEIRKGLWLFLRERWGPPEAFERRSGGICSVFKHPSGCPVKTTCEGPSRSQDTSLEAPESAESAEDPGDSAGVGSLDTGVGKQSPGSRWTSRGPDGFDRSSYNIAGPGVRAPTANHKPRAQVFDH